MKISDILSSPEKWTKNTFAKNADHEACSVFDPKVECFCLEGAIIKAYTLDERKSIQRQVQTLANKLAAAIVRLFPDRVLYWTDGDCMIVCFNDHPRTTFEDVRKVLEDCDL